MAAPDYIPDDLKEMYELYQAEGKQNYIIELDNLYKPQEPTGRKDPFASITATPQQRAEIRAEQERVAQGEAAALAMEQKAIEEIQAQQAQQIEQAIHKILTGDPETFYDRIMQGGVIDPALEPALLANERNINQNYGEEETKAFRTMMLNNIDAGMDPFAAQQSAYLGVQQIVKAERVPAGFVTPPIKQGDLRMVDPTFDQTVTSPTLGSAFGRQVYRTEEQAGQEKLRQQEADKIKSDLYRMFVKQAQAQIVAEGREPKKDEMIQLADQLEENYISGNLLREYLGQVKNDYLNATGLSDDQYKASPEARKEVQQLAQYLYDDFVYNVYPEYSAGYEPEEPSFLKEIMTTTSDKGAIMESRTGQVLRGVGGLIRPVTELVSDVMTYPVIVDEQTGKRTYPEGIPSGMFSFQQPIITTAEREAMSYSDLILSDIAEGRFFGTDVMSMPQLTNEIGEENAGILGMVVEIGLPVTPLGMIGPTAKAAGGTLGVASKITKTKPATAALGMTGKLLEKTKMPTFAKGVVAAPELLDGAEKFMYKVADVANQPITAVAEAQMARRQQALADDLNITPSMMDRAVAEMSAELNARLDALDGLAEGSEALAAEEKIIAELQQNIGRLRDLADEVRAYSPKGVPVEWLPTRAEFGLDEALLRVGAELTPEAKAVYNDVIVAHRLLNEISNSSASGLRSMIDASSPTPFFRKVMQATIFDILKNGNEAEKALAFEFLNSKNFMPNNKFAGVIAGYLGNERTLTRIKKTITEGYIQDYMFNLLPENYVFISPKAAVSRGVYRKYADQVFAETNKFFDDMKIRTEGNKILIDVDGQSLLYMKAYLRDAYGSIAKSKFFKDVLNKLKEGTLELTQEEFNFIHGAVKEAEFSKVTRGMEMVTPQRATQEAVQRADVPLPRRKDLLRMFRAMGRKMFPSIDPKISYAKATQYGLVRILQQTEQEFSNFTIRLQQKVQRTLQANNGNVDITMNQLLREAKEQLGFVNDNDFYFYMLKETFDTTGISDDVLMSFIYNKGINNNPNYVGTFNTLYDDFVQVYKSKEETTMGGKFFERKNTATTYIKTIAQGEKEVITARIHADMEKSFPDLFWEMPTLQPTKTVPADVVIEASQKYQKAVGEANQILAQYPNVADEIANFGKGGSTTTMLEDLDAPAPAILEVWDEASQSYKPVGGRPPRSGGLSDTAKAYQEAQKDARYAAHELNQRISQNVVAAISPDEINQTVLAEQKSFINAMISDLYEGSPYASSYAMGNLSVEGQGFLGTNAARRLITPRNVKRVKEALKGVEEDYIRGYAGQLEEGFEDFAKAQGFEGDELYGYLILQVFRDGNFDALNQITGFKPMALMHSLEAVGFPRISTKYNFESLRPMIESITPTKAVLATPEDIALLKQLSEKSIDGTLGQTLEKLSRKSDNLFNYGVSSAGYAVIALNQSIKGGMLGGFLAPTGKYLTVNSVTAPFIMAYTAPEIMGATFTKLIKTMGGVVVNPLLATLSTAAKAGKFPSSMVSSIGGAFIGGFAAGPLGAKIGASVGGAAGYGANVLGNYVESLLKGSGNANFAQRMLAVYKPEAAVLRTLDGRIITKAEMQAMLERNNIMFGLVNFEFGQSAYDALIRSMGINATGKQANAVRQALRWLRPDRPNFWNTIAMETDNAFRTQVFADSLYLGYTEQQAAEMARRALLDYSDMTAAEQKYIAQYFLFYSFMRQSFVEVAGSLAKGDPTAIRNIAAAIRYGQAQKELANTDELFIDPSMKTKAFAAMWTELGKSYDNTMTMHYGPAFPSTESFMQLANVYYYLYDAFLSDYEVEGGATNVLIETLITKGNPVLQQILQQGSKKFRSENAPHGLVPVREVIALKSSGLFPIAEKFFDLEPIPPEEMSAGRPTYLKPEDAARYATLTDEEKAELRGIQYRIGSKDGSQMYLKFKILLLASGLDRGVQDWASSTAEKLELEGARLKRYTDGNLYLEAAGLSTPIAVPNYYVQRDRHIKQIIKELRAEQD